MYFGSIEGRRRQAIPSSSAVYMAEHATHRGYGQSASGSRESTGYADVLGVLAEGRRRDRHGKGGLRRSLRVCDWSASGLVALWLVVGEVARHGLG